MVQEEKRLEEERDQNQNQDEEEDEIKLEEEEEEMNIWPWRNERISTELGETLDIGCGSDGSRIVTLEEFMSVWEGICRLFISQSFLSIYLSIFFIDGTLYCLRNI